MRRLTSIFVNQICHFKEIQRIDKRLLFLVRNFIDFRFGWRYETFLQMYDIYRWPNVQIFSSNNFSREDRSVFYLNHEEIWRAISERWHSVINDQKKPEKCLRITRQCTAMSHFVHNFMVTKSFDSYNIFSDAFHLFYQTVRRGGFKQRMVWTWAFRIEMSPSFWIYPRDTSNNSVDYLQEYIKLNHHQVWWFHSVYFFGKTVVKPS